MAYHHTMFPNWNNKKKWDIKKISKYQKNARLCSYLIDMICDEGDIFEYVDSQLADFESICR